MMRTWQAALVAAALVLGGGAAGAKDPTPLFASDDVLRLTISGELSALAQAAPSANRVVDGTLTVAGTSPETLAVKLSPRGITRRQKDVCQFPPLRVEFPVKPPAGSLFKGQKRLKLVTHCRSSPAFQQYVLLEHAAYRMYNVLTPLSFRSRLATLDYLDANGRPTVTRLGFFIEDADDVAERNGLLELDFKERLRVSQLSARDAARFALFEYMIGNLDWAMTAGPAGTDCCHNSRLVGAKAATTGIVPVPYDFDFAGIVDAPYATSPATIPLPNVRVRRYRGYCRHNAEVQAAAADMLAKRGELVAVLQTVPQLDDKNRRKAAAYLEGFFAQIADPQTVQAKLLANCLS